MSKKSMVAINPQVSLTIGNPEIVNMLVQQQVRALKNERARLEKDQEALRKVRTERLEKVVRGLRTDFENAHGKNLVTLVKAYTALTGKK